jgi:hypothetical protein
MVADGQHQLLVSRHQLLADCRNRQEIPDLPIQASDYTVRTPDPKVTGESGYDLIFTPLIQQEL